MKRKRAATKETTEPGHGDSEANANHERRVVGLLNWMNDNGIELDERAIELQVEADDDSAGVRVIARRDITASVSKPHLLARVPKSACLSLKNVPQVAQRYGHHKHMHSAFFFVTSSTNPSLTQQIFAWQCLRYTQCTKDGIKNMVTKPHCCVTDSKCLV